MDWKEWRSNGLGSSDAPVIMGVSPYKTRYQLWEEKLSLADYSQGNWATNRGNDLEPKARAHYELVYGRNMPATLIEHRDYPFIRASLDGFDGEVVLEIKCPGKEDHLLAAQGKIPEKYWPQVQHQLLASGAAECHYYSFDGNVGVLISVKPDLEYCAKLRGELINFWDLVKTQNPPALSDQDFKIIDNMGLAAKIGEWSKIKSEIEERERLEASMRKDILSGLGEHPRWKCGNVSIIRSFRRGAAIAPDDAPRKPGSYSWTFRRGKDD